MLTTSVITGESTEAAGETLGRETIPLAMEGVSVTPPQATSKEIITVEAPSTVSITAPGPQVEALQSLSSTSSRVSDDFWAEVDSRVDF